MRRHFLILLSLLSALPAASATEQCPRSPGIAARNLYEVHQDFIFKGASSPPLSPLFAQAVGENLLQQQKTGDAGPIDWNYWTSAQDGKQSKTAVVSSASVKATQTQVTLKYRFFSSPGRKAVPMKAVVTLSQTGEGCWLVEDVARGKNSVMSYLKSGRQVATPPR